jgi:hypothetical protein
MTDPGECLESDLTFARPKTGDNRTRKPARFRYSQLVSLRGGANARPEVRLENYLQRLNWQVLGHRHQFPNQFRLEDFFFSYRFRVAPACRPLRFG